MFTSIRANFGRARLIVQCVGSAKVGVTDVLTVDHLRGTTTTSRGQTASIRHVELSMTLHGVFVEI